MMTGYWQRLSTNRVSRRKALKAGAAGLGAGALALAGCGGGGDENGGNATPIVEGTPQAGGTVVYGLDSDPGHLDEQEGVTNYWVTSQFNGFLYHINLPTQEMMLQMADKFEQPDHQTYIWTLKPGIKFHNVDPVNGREVTADDVVYSMKRRLEDPTSQNDKQFLRDFTAGMEATDPLTFKLTTKQPYRPTIDELGNPSYPIVPHEAVERFGSLADHPIGCGAYILTEFVRAERVRMQRNPDYFMPGRPYLETIEWQFILDSSTCLQAFETGQHDYTAVSLDKLKVERLQTDSNNVILDAPNFWRHTLLLRVDQDPFKDPRTWEAIDLAVDRQDLIDKMAFGEGKFTGPVPISLTQYTLPEDELRDFYRVDIQKAKQLLSAAGFDNGLTFECPVENVVDMQKFSTVVKDQLAKVNITMNLVPRELGVFLAQNMYARNFQGMTYYNLPYVEPDRPLCQYYSKGQAGFSFSGYSNPAMDAWVEKERAEFDNEVRAQIIKDAQREMIKEHGPQINTYIPNAWAAFKKWVHGVDKVVGIGAWSYLNIDIWTTPRT
jgi:peptide/nickel transport system substrate-binding protein